MQDAWSNGWTRNTHLSTPVLESLRELNHRFLELLAARSGKWDGVGRLGLSAELAGHVAPLSTLQKAAAASCPYALFDLHFDDDAHWQARLRGSGGWRVADESPQDSDVLEFTRVAIFFAWHVASTAPLAARLLLGMSEATASAFHDATVDCLSPLVANEARHLNARWRHCPVYWNSLVRAAAHPNLRGLRRIQLYGVQLAAAAQLRRL